MSQRRQDVPGEPQIDAELRAVADDMADEARTYLLAVRSMAQGDARDTALPLILLALSQIQVAGARLGAMVDIVPRERFEPDAGPDLDLDAVREGLGLLLTGVDAYAEVADPVVSTEVSRGDISNDLTAVAADLTHGLRHFDAGRITEALWWWQFSYLSSWGERAASALRAVLALLSHVRLDIDEEVAMEAEMAALHTEPPGFSDDEDPTP
ncbi:MAG: DUF5063 domain-containing protein [Ornithinimicrobium sp.]